MRPVPVLATFLLLPLLANPGRAQCCYGAHHIRVDTADGRLRVEARSLTGAGIPGPHGPYHYRFVLLEKEGKAWVERASFEKRWETKGHFHMFLAPSATGNGVLIHGPKDACGRFFDWKGRELRRLAPTDRFHIGIEGMDVGRVARPKGDLHYPWVRLRIRALNSVIGVRWLIPASKGHGRNRVDVKFLLPLALPIPEERRSPEDRERVAWWTRFLEREEPLGGHGAEGVERLIGQLSREEAKKAAAALLELGPPVLPRLRAAEIRAEDPTPIRSVIDAIHRRSSGHAQPSKNPRLLCALLSLPDARLRAAAKKRLQPLLPEGATIKREWILSWLAEQAQPKVSSRPGGGR